MKKLFLIPLVVLTVSLGLFPASAQAKSVQWNTFYNGHLGYARNIGGTHPWVSGLADFNVTVSYAADVYNAATDTLLGDGSVMPVGTRIAFRPKVFEDTDISWFGTGGMADSPYGHWVAQALRPSGSACSAKDYVGFNTGGLFPGLFSIFVPFAIAPPATLVTHAGTAGLTCDTSGSLCTVTSPGSIATTFSFSPTVGKFYFESQFTRFGSCAVIPEPMRICGPLGFAGECTSVGASDYILSVPAQTIRFDLTAVPANPAPATPSLAVDAPSKTANSAFTFTAQASDLNDDPLRYGFDWNQDGSVDQWMPSSDFVASNSPQSASHLWVSPGTYAVQVLAEDNGRAQSGWSAPVTVTVVAPPVTLKVCNGSILRGISTAPPEDNAFSLVQGLSEDLTVYYGTEPDCFGGTDVTRDAGWSEESANPVIGIAPVGNKERVSANAPGSESLSVSYGGLSVETNMRVSVNCAPTLTCSDPDVKAVTDNYCSYETAIDTGLDDGCGATVVCPSGTRSCDFNWQEVTP